MEVDGRHEARRLIFSVAVADEINEAIVLQLIEYLEGEADGNVAGGGQLGSRERRLLLLIALADERHLQQRRELVETLADILHVFVEVILLQVLADVRQLDAKEDDAPEDVEEEHQKRDDGERTVDGIVGRDADLHVDVEVEERLEDGTRDQARDDGMTETNLRVREEDEHGREDESRQEEGGYLDDDVGKGAEDVEPLQLGIEGGHEDARTGNADDEEREEKEHGEVVGDLAEDGARLADTPYHVHALLDVAGQRDDGPEEDEQADADEDTAVRVLEVGVDERHDGVERIAADGNAVAEERLHEVGESEATGYGEQQGEDGDKREHRGVGERLGSHLDTIANKMLHGEIDDLEHRVTLASLRADLSVFHSPDGLSQKGEKLAEFALCVHISYLERRVSSRPVSRVLYPSDGASVIYLHLTSPSG